MPLSKIPTKAIASLCYLSIALANDPTPEEKKILETIGKYPDLVAQIIEHGINNKKAEEKINIAKNIKKNLDKVMQESIKLNGDDSSFILMILDYTCPHCHHKLSTLSSSKFLDQKTGLRLLSLPIFESDISRQYGILMTEMFSLNEKAYLNILDNYPPRNIENLKEKIAEARVKIDPDLLKDLKKYDSKQTLLEDLEVAGVPMFFYVMDDKSGGKIVVPLANIEFEELQKVVKELDVLSADDIKKMNEELGQTKKK